METGSRPLERLGGQRVVVALGVVYVAIAVWWVSGQLAAGVSPVSAAIVFALIGGPGVSLVYGGRRLPALGVHDAFSVDVARWCLLAFALMCGLLGLYHVQPDATLAGSFQTVLILTALSTVAGFGVGTQNARAKTRERELERRNAELEAARADLETAVSELEASNERLEQFAYAASHDLQEPLRMVSSYLGLLERQYGDDLDETALEYVAFAVDGAERMREMVDALLEYSRVETRGNAFEPVDLETLLADVRKDLELSIHASEAALTVDDLPHVYGDARQLRQVFQNLLSNAISYSGDAPPRVRVSAEPEDSMWTVSVSDAGVGIDPEAHERVFGVFERLHTQEEQPGTGIGLALCKRVVERHGGTIWLESIPGEGTTVSFTLPAADDS
ncbi:sensor histidine kinase [Natronobiforma cellulositropha]|uniref:sensor histidine kinase n=1 Tax=Natronobiforma cellulositropha TaxID=1679076 RepID=UPI0021D5CA7F|nr:ATP-binding protein [Natronobiforma cellulositropha]